MNLKKLLDIWRSLDYETSFQFCDTPLFSAPNWHPKCLDFPLVRCCVCLNKEVSLLKPDQTTGSKISARILRCSVFWHSFQICVRPLQSASSWQAYCLDFFRPGTVCECLANKNWFTSNCPKLAGKVSPFLVAKLSENVLEMHIQNVPSLNVPFSKRSITKRPTLKTFQTQNVPQLKTSNTKQANKGTLPVDHIFPSAAPLHTWIWVKLNIVEMIQCIEQ